MEVRLGKSDRRGMVVISGYFWVCFLGSWVCGSVFMGIWRGLQWRDRFAAGFV